MAKQITFDHEGTVYTLEFTRKSVETMERRGFVADDISRKPMTVIPDLFAGAFLAHHRYVKKEVVDAIYSSLDDKQALIGALAEMYNEPILSLIEGQGDDSGNIKWEKVW